MSKPQANIVNIAKGLIQPSDIVAGGDLRPEESDKLISMVFETDFLSKIHTQRMRRNESAIDVIDVARRQLVRLAEGTEPKDNAGVSEKGSVLQALPVQLFPAVKLSTLRNNKDNPNIVNTIEMSFATVMTRDLVDLGFNGVDDDNSGADAAAKFVNLNKGWLQVAADSDDTIDVAKPAGAKSTWVAYLAKVLAAADERYTADSVFIMNTADADAYGIELGGHVTGTALVADSPLRRFQGRPIVDHAYMPRGKVLFTPIKNLVFGMNTEIRRDRGWHMTKRIIQYTFDMAIDYEITIKKAVVLGQPASSSSKGEKASEGVGAEGDQGS